MKCKYRVSKTHTVPIHSFVLDVAVDPGNNHACTHAEFYICVILDYTDDFYKILEEFYRSDTSIHRLIIVLHLV